MWRRRRIAAVKEAKAMLDKENKTKEKAVVGIEEKGRRMGKLKRPGR